MADRPMPATTSKPQRLRILLTMLAAIVLLIVAWRSYVAPQPWGFSSAVQNAARTTLYEGLPHQMFEREMLASELETEDTLRIQNYPFYRQPLALSDANARALRAIVCASETFSRQTPGTYKMCGGFHPDYCVEWTSGSGTTTHALICFGCGEAILTGGLGPVTLDIQTGARKALEALLKPYVQNRPPWRSAEERLREAEESLRRSESESKPQTRSSASAPDRP